MPSQTSRSRCEPTVVRSSFAGVHLFFSESAYPPSVPVAGR